MKYYNQFGSHPEISALFHMSGPQDESQVPQEVQDLFKNRTSVKTVAIIYDHGMGERIDIYTPAKEQT